MSWRPLSCSEARGFITNYTITYWRVGSNAANAGTITVSGEDASSAIIISLDSVLIHCTGCYAPVYPGGESGERVPVCAGTVGETMSYGADYGELGCWNYSSCGQLSSIYAQRHQRHPSTNTNKK